jgi:hypothetical protein
VQMSINAVTGPTAGVGVTTVEIFMSAHAIERTSPGRVGMVGLIVAEASLFAVFVFGALLVVLALRRRSRRDPKVRSSVTRAA